MRPDTGRAPCPFPDLGALPVLHKVGGDRWPDGLVCVASATGGIDGIGGNFPYCIRGVCHPHGHSDQNFAPIKGAIE